MGAYSRNPHVETYRCDDTSRQLLDRLLSNGFGFGCRDLFSERVLHSWGYADTVLTGCPAWYDLQFVESTDFVTPPPSTPQHIVVSDPADIYNKEYARHLIVLLRNMFPQARISFVFHAGWEADEFTNDLKARLCCELRDWLRDQGIQTQNAAYSTEGFSIYDTCDVHIGFRVHAHLYALSQRRPSILIEEDGRGFGANEALGIPHVPIWPETLFHDYVQKVLKRFCGRPPVLSTHQIESFLGAIQTRIAEELDSGYASAQRAFEAMAATYLSMREHIGRLEACSGARAS
ncbi:MAG: polysaccharide pyruvyl transferase family protein [Eggerthellaceae bacterium]|nr:polysaccharide pyruvyl transferase family protein [Eggerthellaceae bacterium]